MYKGPHPCKNNQDDADLVPHDGWLADDDWLADDGGLQMAT